MGRVAYDPMGKVIETATPLGYSQGYTSKTKYDDARHLPTKTIDPMGKEITLTGAAG